MDTKLVRLRTLRAAVHIKHRIINQLQKQIKEKKNEMKQIALEYADENNFCIIELGMPEYTRRREYVYMATWNCNVHMCTHDLCPIPDDEKKYLSNLGEPCQRDRVSFSSLKRHTRPIGMEADIWNSRAPTREEWRHIIDNR